MQIKYFVHLLLFHSTFYIYLLLGNHSDLILDCKATLIFDKSQLQGFCCYCVVFCSAGDCYFLHTYCVVLILVQHCKMKFTFLFCIKRKILTFLYLFNDHCFCSIFSACTLHAYSHDDFRCNSIDEGILKSCNSSTIYRKKISFHLCFSIQLPFIPMHLAHFSFKLAML